MLNKDEDEDKVVLGKGSALLLLGLALVFIGIAIIVVATLFLGGSGSVGGIILIGPIPIVFGAGPEAGWLIAVGAAITIISIVLFIVLNRRTRGSIY